MPLLASCPGALAQRQVLGPRAPGLFLSPNLRHAAFRPRRKRSWGGVRSSLGSSAFGPHRQGRDAGTPRPVQAVRTEAAPAGSLSLQQRRLQQLWDIAAPSAALEAADAALLELRQIRERLSGAGPKPPGRDGLIATPEPQTANAIVPAGARVLGRRAGLVQLPPLSPPAQEQQPEEQEKQQEEIEQQQQQLEPAAPKRRGRRKGVASEGAPEEASAWAAASAAAPKRRGRPRKAASLGSSLQLLAVPPPQLGTEGGEAAAAPRRRQGRKAGAAVASVQASAAGVAEAAAAPAPRRRRCTRAAAPSVQASSEVALDQILETVAQLAASVGLPSAPAVEPAGQQPPVPEPAAAEQPAAPSFTLGASEAGLEASSAAAPPAAAVAVAAEPAVAQQTKLVRSTRVAARSPSLTPAKGAAAAALLPPRVVRRSRLVVRAARRQPAGDVLAGAQQQGVAAPCEEQQQLTEGQRDAAFLSKMRAALQKGRRKKRTSVTDSLTMFLSRMGHTPVLGKEQEGRLARILQKGRRVRAAAAELQQRLGREPTTAEVGREAGLAQAEAELRLDNEVEAKDLLVQYNLRLVVHIAKKYSNQGLELSDLIQEGELGLRKSIDRYDPDRGFRFSTYAHWYIRQPISRAVAEQGRDVRLPVHVCEVVTKIYRTEAELNKDPNRAEPASKEELARALGMPLPRLLQFLRLARAPRVVERHGGEATMLTPSMKELTLDEQWEDDEFLEQVEGVNKHEFMKQNVSFILSTLPKRERNILRLRYGLLQHDEDEEAVAGGSSSSSLEVAATAVVGGPSAYDPFAEPAAGGASLAALPAASGAYQQMSQLQRAAAAQGGSGASADRPPEALSLTEVSWAYGLSKERIRQIEDRALRALRNPWRVRLLHEINNGNRLSAGTLAHLAGTLAARPLRRGGNGGDSGTGPQIN